eukprot:COSAG02_NODE_1983_length_10192_cov_119.688231_2_plen_142_part_00
MGGQGEDGAAERWGRPDGAACARAQNPSQQSSIGSTGQPFEQPAGDASQSPQTMLLTVKNTDYRLTEHCVPPTLPGDYHMWPIKSTGEAVQRLSDATMCHHGSVMQFSYATHLCPSTSRYKTYPLCVPAVVYTSTILVHVL